MSAGMVGTTRSTFLVRTVNTKTGLWMNSRGLGTEAECRALIVKRGATQWWIERIDRTMIEIERGDS